jgi:hypothetical protein
MLLAITMSWMNIRYLAAKGKRIELEVNLGWKGFRFRVKVR